jgi:hypothetical protein
MSQIFPIPLIVCGARTAVECRDFFEPGGSQKLASVVKHFIDEDINVVKSCLNVSKVVAKSENVKGWFLLYLLVLAHIITAFLGIQSHS